MPPAPGIRAAYTGPYSKILDESIERAASPGKRWASGYDLRLRQRDISFEYTTEHERNDALARLRALPMVVAEPENPERRTP